MQFTDSPGNPVKSLHMLNSGAIPMPLLLAYATACFTCSKTAGSVSGSRRPARKDAVNSVNEVC